MKFPEINSLQELKFLVDSGSEFHVCYDAKKIIEAQSINVPVRTA